MNVETTLVLNLNRWLTEFPGVYQLERNIANTPELITPAILAYWWFSETYVRFSAAELRRRALLAFAALPLAYVLAQIIQRLVHRPRPLNALSLQTSAPTDFGIEQHALTKLGSFPSDHEALLFILIVFAFSVNRRLAWVLLAFAIVYGILRVAVGYHWPSDIIGGAVLGAAIAAALLALKPQLTETLDNILGLIQRHRAVSYTIGFIIMAEFANGFTRLKILANSLLHASLFH